METKKQNKISLAFVFSVVILFAAVGPGVAAIEHDEFLPNGSYLTVLYCSLESSE